MTITYTNPISGDELAALTEEDAKIMAQILYDVRIQNHKSYTFAYEKTHLEAYTHECKWYFTLPEPFLIQAYDGDKCVGFRFIKPVKYTKLGNLQTEEDIKKYGRYRQWFIDQGLNFNEGLAPGFFGIHKDYNEQGIATEIRVRCNEESKKRGYTWVLGQDIDSKSRWEWTMHFYKKSGIDVIMSDLRIPKELGGYGNFYYYRI